MCAMSVNLKLITFLSLALAWSVMPVACLGQPAEGVANAVVWYRLDEGKGGAAADSSGLGNDGQIIGAKWAKGQTGGALDFTNPGAHIVCRHTPALAPGKDDWTIEASFYWHGSTGRWQMIVNRCGGAYNVDRYAIGIQDSALSVILFDGKSLGINHERVMELAGG